MLVFFINYYCFNHSFIRILIIIFFFLGCLANHMYQNNVGFYPLPLRHPFFFFFKFKKHIENEVSKQQQQAQSRITENVYD